MSQLRPASGKIWPTHGRLQSSDWLARKMVQRWSRSIQNLLHLRKFTVTGVQTWPCSEVVGDLQVHISPWYAHQESPASGFPTVNSEPLLQPHDWLFCGADWVTLSCKTCLKRFREQPQQHRFVCAAKVESRSPCRGFRFKTAETWQFALFVPFTMKSGMYFLLLRRHARLRDFGCPTYFQKSRLWPRSWTHWLHKQKARLDPVQPHYKAIDVSQLIIMLANGLFQTWNSGSASLSNCRASVRAGFRGAVRVNLRRHGFKWYIFIRMWMSETNLYKIRRLSVKFICVCVYVWVYGFFFHYDMAVICLCRSSRSAYTFSKLLPNNL
jgi:hypothetical protein